MKSQENRIEGAAKLGNSREARIATGSGKSVKARVYLLAAVIGVALSFSACTSGGTPDTSATEKKQTMVGTEQVSSKIKTFMGSVSNKVGNDLTVSLGEFVMDEGSGDQQVMMVDENGNQTLVEGASMDNPGGNEVIIRMPEGDAASDSTSGGSGAAASGESAANEPIDKMPIAFTGEVKDFTVPAGAKIVNAMGQEITLDQIVQGSIVQLIVDEATGVVERILVM